MDEDIDEHIISIDCLYQPFQKNDDRYVVTIDENDVFLVDSRYLKKITSSNEKLWNEGKLKLVVSSMTNKSVSVKFTDYFTWCESHLKDYL